MLALSRKVGEAVYIDGGRIIVRVVMIKGNRVRLLFQAPDEMPIHREEVQLDIDKHGPRPGGRK